MCAYESGEIKNAGFSFWVLVGIWWTVSVGYRAIIAATAAPDTVATSMNGSAGMAHVTNTPDLCSYSESGGGVLRLMDRLPDSAASAQNVNFSCECLLCTE